MKRLIAVLMLLATPTLGATPTDTTVAFYHGAPDRAANYVVPGLTRQSAGRVHRDQDFDGRIEGHVYAQPLYWRERGAQHGLVIVPTESDRVFALDADSGRIVWRTALGPPVAGAALPCGNVDPLGVTGTPVIDARRDALYLDAMVDEQGRPRHRIYGLRLTDGAIMAGFPIDVAAGLAARGFRFDPAAQNQRGALTILNGRVVVPFGGHYGDCSDYHGFVVAISTAPPELAAAWTTRAAKGGIWAPAGVSEAGGQLYFSTGNTEGASRWLDGEGILRVGADLAHATDPRAFFAPSDWKDLDEDDLDLGGVTPLPLTLPGTEWLLALGKDGNAYLLNRVNLGGIGGAIATQKAARGAIITAPALYPDRGSMVAAYQARGALCPNGSTVSGIGALAISTDPSHPLASAWCAKLDGRGAPIVTTTDGRSDAIVWVAGAEGDERLHGYRGDSGADIFAGGGPRDGMTGLRHFATILVADGHFYIAGDGRIFAYRLPQ
ncbi:MAG: PQQ-binding-like beta-propeller repeat protein [Acetobacteraceae bacterium]|nr:PQQ-binding-like beta-propeller repeat protein [Acetobacteraceae bacterium]